MRGERGKERDIPGRAARVVVDGIVRDGAAKGDEVAGDQAAKGQDLRGLCRLGVALEVEVLAAAADGDDDGDEVGDPGPALPEVEGLEAHQGDGEGDEAHDDDADVDADLVGVERGQRLAAHDGREQGEAGEGGCV
jgi:hypothetical protein